LHRSGVDRAFVREQWTSGLDALAPTAAVVVVPMRSGSSVTESEELMGSTSLLSRLPQYLITAMLEAHVAVATCRCIVPRQQGWWVLRHPGPHARGAVDLRSFRQHGDTHVRHSSSRQADVAPDLDAALGLLDRGLRHYVRLRVCGMEAFS